MTLPTHTGAWFGDFHRNFGLVFDKRPYVYGPEPKSVHEVVLDGCRGIGRKAEDRFHTWLSVEAALTRSDLSVQARPALEFMSTIKYVVVKTPVQNIPWWRRDTAAGSVLAEGGGSLAPSAQSSPRGSISTDDETKVVNPMIPKAANPAHFLYRLQDFKITESFRKTLWGTSWPHGGVGGLGEGVNEFVKILTEWDLITFDSMSTMQVKVDRISHDKKETVMQTVELHRFLVTRGSKAPTVEGHGSEVSYHGTHCVNTSTILSEGALRASDDDDVHEKTLDAVYTTNILSVAIEWPGAQRIYTCSHPQCTTTPWGYVENSPPYPAQDSRSYEEYQKTIDNYDKDRCPYTRFVFEGRGTHAPLKEKSFGGAGSNQILYAKGKHFKLEALIIVSGYPFNNRGQRAGHYRLRPDLAKIPVHTDRAEDAAFHKKCDAVALLECMVKPRVISRFDHKDR